MSVTAGVLLGIAVGTGLLLLARGLWPEPPSLAAQLAALPAPTPNTVSIDDHANRWTRIVGPQLAAACADLAWLPKPTHADLAVTRTSNVGFYATKAAGAVAGLLLPATIVLAAAVFALVDFLFEHDPSNVTKVIYPSRC